MKNTFSSEQIQVVMEKSGITRKSALKKLGKMTPKELAVLTVTPRNAAIALNQESALKPEVAADYKRLAANDDTQVAPPAPVTAPAKATTPEPPKPQTDAGKARSEGIRLFKLAGKPKKDDFIHVYGKPGVAWTWVARAKAVGLATAEEAAAQFQAMLAKPAQSCLVPDTKEKK